MRSLKILFIALLMTLAWACEEDFEINAPYQDITVVFGLVDPSDDTIFLKINKAFLGEGNTMEMAKIEDSSSYINGLNATIEEWEYNLGTGQFIRYLRFENGRLIRITTGDYGY